MLKCQIVGLSYSRFSYRLDCFSSRNEFREHDVILKPTPRGFVQFIIRASVFNWTRSSINFPNGFSLHERRFELFFSLIFPPKSWFKKVQIERGDISVTFAVKNVREISILTRLPVWESVRHLGWRPKTFFYLILKAYEAWPGGWRICSTFYNILQIVKMYT